MEAIRHFMIAFLLTLPYSLLEANQNDCSSILRCNNLGPPVRFPFRLRHRHPNHCGFPGFNLYCSAKNETMVKLPFSGEFIVTNIDYKSQFLDVADPNDCISRRVLQQLNFSSSPFHQFKARDTNNDRNRIEGIHFEAINVTFLNCSREFHRYFGLGDDSIKRNCFSGPGYEVIAYIAEHGLDYYKDYENQFDIVGCRKFRTIPNVLIVGSGFNFPYDYNFALRFSWSIEVCRSCKERCRLKNRSIPPFAECFNNKGLALKLLKTGLTLGTLLIVLVTAVIVHKCYNAHRCDKIERKYQVKIDKFLQDYQALKPTRYLYEDIKRMTNQFSDILGKGGFGSVYKGTIGNDLQVAVKILNDFKGNGEDFTNEVGTIGMIHHVNIVRLVGFCADGIKKALVYEFMPNESLEKYIFSKDSITPSLGWEKLQEIAMGIAKGIEYLHQGCDQRILHFDIKPHNILLDQNMKPKISDFGLAKLSSRGESIVSMTAARGTIGYIAPEVFSRNFGNVSYKSDVYSFGMLVLEMVGGRRNIDNTAANSSQVYFPEWAYNHLNQDKELGIQIDNDKDRRIAKKLTVVALWCIQWYPADRPTMTAVVHMLEGKTENLIMPSNPFASTDEPETSFARIEKPSHTVLTIIPEIEES